MKLLPCSALVLIASSCQGPRGGDLAIEPFPEHQREVESAIRDLLAAASRKDFERLEAMHLYGPKFSKWDGRKRERSDAEATRREERAGIEPLDAFRPHVEDLKIDVFGETAVATFVMPFEVVAGGQTAQRVTQATLVWLKTPSGWKVVHEHFTPMPASP